MTDKPAHEYFYIVTLRWKELEGGGMEAALVDKEKTFEGVIELEDSDYKDAYYGVLQHIFNNNMNIPHNAIVLNWSLNPASLTTMGPGTRYFITVSAKWDDPTEGRTEASTKFYITDKHGKATMENLYLEMVKQVRIKFTIPAEVEKIYIRQWTSHPTTPLSSWRTPWH